MVLANIGLFLKRHPKLAHQAHILPLMCAGFERWLLHGPSVHINTRFNLFLCGAMASPKQYNPVNWNLLLCK